MTTQVQTEREATSVEQPAEKSPKQKQSQEDFQKDLYSAKATPPALRNGGYHLMPGHLMILENQSS